MEHIESEPNNETQPQPRRRLCERVAEEVGAQRQAAEMDAFEEAAFADPAFDKRSGTSNFGKRVAARVQIATRQ